MKRIFSMMLVFLLIFNSIAIADISETEVKQDQMNEELFVESSTDETQEDAAEETTEESNEEPAAEESSEEPATGESIEEAATEETFVEAVSTSNLVTTEFIVETDATLEELIANENISTITIEEDTTVTGILVVDRPITIEGNGHTLFLTQSSGKTHFGTIQVVAGGSLTLNHVNVDGTGNSIHTLISVDAGGHLEVEGGTFSGSYIKVYDGEGIYVVGTANINNAEFTGIERTNVYFKHGGSGSVTNSHFDMKFDNGEEGALRYGIMAYYGSEVTVLNNTFENFVNKNEKWSSGAISIGGIYEVSTGVYSKGYVSGNTINNGTTGISYGAWCDVTIGNNTFNGTENEISIEAVDEGTADYGFTVQKLLDLGRDKIYISEDAILDIDSLVIDYDVEFIGLGNGSTLRLTQSSGKTHFGTIQVVAGGSLTLNHVNIDGTGNSIHTLVSVAEGGHLEVEGGTFSGSYVSVYNGEGIYVEGTANINNAEFTGIERTNVYFKHGGSGSVTNSYFDMKFENEGEEGALRYGVMAYFGADVTIKNNTFINFVNKNEKWGSSAVTIGGIYEVHPSFYTGEFSKGTISGNTIYNGSTGISYGAWSNVSIDNNTFVETEEEIIVEAFDEDSADYGVTLQSLLDLGVNKIYFAKDTTFDIEGLIIDYDVEFIGNGSTLKLTQSSGAVHTGTIQVVNGGSLTLNHVNIDGTGNSIHTLVSVAKGGHLEVEGGTFSGSYVSVYNGEGIYVEGTANINNAVFTGIERTNVYFKFGGSGSVTNSYFDMKFDNGEDGALRYGVMAYYGSHVIVENNTFKNFINKNDEWSSGAISIGGIYEVNSGNFSSGSVNGNTVINGTTGISYGAWCDVTIGDNTFNGTKSEIVIEALDSDSAAYGFTLEKLLDLGLEKIYFAEDATIEISEALVIDHDVEFIGNNVTFNVSYVTVDGPGNDSDFLGALTVTEGTTLTIKNANFVSGTQLDSFIHVDGTLYLDHVYFNGTKLDGDKSGAAGYGTAQVFGDTTSNMTIVNSTFENFSRQGVVSKGSDLVLDHNVFNTHQTAVNVKGDGTEWELQYAVFASGNANATIINNQFNGSMVLAGPWYSISLILWGAENANVSGNVFSGQVMEAIEIIDVNNINDVILDNVFADAHIALTKWTSFDGGLWESEYYVRTATGYETGKNDPDSVIVEYIVTEAEIVDEAGRNINVLTLNMGYGYTTPEIEDLDVVTLPELAVPKSVLWEVVTGDDVVTVDENTGLVTAKSRGTAVVKVIVNKTIEAEITVRVNVINAPVIVPPVITPPPTAQNNIKIDANKVELEYGSEALETMKTYALTLTDESIPMEDLTWSSDNTDVVTVDENGQLVAVGEGEATVTVTHNESKKSDKVKVTVYLVGNEETPLGAVDFVLPYISGYSDDTFRPEASITRAE
ncbi:MAG: Ig-like domain-containing protein, partial [Clostridia bacterium]|nr:Ig-like domain-containing protein [Clostridia bacterium]